MTPMEWIELWWPPMLGLATVMAATSAAAHAILTKRSAHATIAWVGLIAFVPLFGALFYLLFGVNRIRRKATALRPRRALPGVQRSAPSPHACTPEAIEGASMRTLAALGWSVTHEPLLQGNAVEVLRDGDAAYPRMLEAIRGAEHTIALSVYIFDNDPIGRVFAQALAEAHARGVEVRVLVDSVGAHYTWPSVMRQLRRDEVPAHTFMPILRPGKFSFLNLRTHRKILVVDGRTGFTGGINIRQGHVLADAPPDPTHDTHFQIEGPLVGQMAREFAQDWVFSSGEELEGPSWFPELERAGQVIARGISDGPDESFENLHWTLLGALSAALERVVIVTPYFLPEDTLLDMLQLTAMRGVRVDIVLPQRSNLRFVDFASRASWAPLLRNGCRIWLEPQPFDHSKLMIIDGYWSLFGSANWDPRSMRLNFEFNVEAYDADLARRLLSLASTKIARSTQVLLEDFERRNILLRLRDGLFRMGTPYL